MGRTGTSGRNVGNDRKHFAAMEWRKRAVQMRLQGFSVRIIADRLGLSPTAVKNALSAARQAIPVEDVEDLRALHAEKIERLQRKYRPRADIDERAAEVYLKALAAERQLLGLNAPERSTVTVNTDDATLLARLAALADTERKGEGDSAADPGGEGAPGDDAGGDGEPS